MSHNAGIIDAVQVYAVEEPPPGLGEALRRGLGFLESQQRADGCVVGEVVWCPMITAQYVMVSYVTKRALTPQRAEAIERYLRGQQRADGGWAMHPASGSYVFCTALVYVALRMLGVEAADDACARALGWLRAHGGVAHTPTWGKLWLWLVNLYGRAGVPPMLPELWLLPTTLPFHPSKMYCHTRLIYMAMSYLYGAGAQAEADALTLSLRDELYGAGQFEAMDWAAQREALAPTDLYERPSPLLRLFYSAAAQYEARAPRGWRRLALAECLEQIVHHQRQSGQAAISPVNGLLNVLALQHAGHPDAQAAYDGMDHWLWDDAQGARFAGAGSHTWDTAFAVQALTEGELAGAQGFLEGAARFLRGAQMQGELPAYERFFRDPARGGFCFSDGYHRWPVSDCTAEAVSALNYVARRGGQGLEGRALEDATRFILQRQNPDGGWGSYERRRGPLWLEQLNPSEMFSQCMVEHSYVECTASCMHALRLTLEGGKLKGALVAQAEAAISAGQQVLRATQREDGAWPGFWGVHMTYGTLFGVIGLRAAGDTAHSPAIQRALRWLLSSQRPDGAWGEHWRGCLEGRSVPSEEPQPIQTAWAMLGILKACADAPLPAAAQRALDAAARYLITHQQPDGAWPRQQVAGVFFSTAMLHYDLYRAYFPLWALGLYDADRRDRAAPR